MLEQSPSNPKRPHVGRQSATRCPVMPVLFWGESAFTRPHLGIPTEMTPERRRFSGTLNHTTPVRALTTAIRWHSCQQKRECIAHCGGRSSPKSPRLLRLHGVVPRRHRAPQATYARGHRSPQTPHAPGTVPHRHHTPRVPCPADTPIQQPPRPTRPASRATRAAQRLRSRSARWISRLASRRFITSRLSCSFLPFARPISTLQKPFFRYSRVGTRV
jgi:hypothetical protein